MSNNVQIPITDRVRSLERSEAQVLYGRCHGKTHGQIAATYGKTSDTWSRNLMTRVFEKVGVPKTDSRDKKNEFLRKQVCPVLTEILQEDEANLEKWPLFGWVALREGDNVTYREREERERPYLDVRDDVPEPEDIDLPLDNEDEESELKPLDRNETEDLEEDEEVPSERVSPESIPPPTDPGTSSSSPEPENDFEWRPPPNRPLNRLWLLVPVLICITCVGLALYARNRLAPLFTRALTSTPTFAPTNAPTNALTNTPQTPLPTQSQPGSPTPAATSTPEIPPTAFPLPIKENFNQQYSELWQVSGDPIVAKGIHYEYDGVLTTRQGGRASISIGNTAWTNYAVYFRVDWLGGGYGYTTIGVRVIDLNNMIQLSCQGNTCDWVVVYQGERDVLQTQQYIQLRTSAIVSAQGDTFTAFGDGGTQADYSLSFILPPKYKGKFDGGGVYFEISNMEADYIEIQPLN